MPRQKNLGHPLQAIELREVLMLDGRARVRVRGGEYSTYARLSAAIERVAIVRSRVGICASITSEACGTHTRVIWLYGSL